MLLPMTAGAVNSGQCGNNVYFTYDKSTHILTIYGEGGMYNYSSSIFDESPWYSISGIQSVIIEPGVTSIGNWAFYWCSGITSVTIPNSVTTIGGYAFEGCTKLTSVTIPSSVTYIGNCAFDECRGLTSVHITDLEAWLKIKFDDSPLDYAHHLYMNGKEITEIVVPNSVTRIELGAIRGCTSLTSIIVEDGNPTYDSRDNCNALIETASNTLIFGCKNSFIPHGVTSIGGAAFSNCSGLTSLTIPNSVTSIGSYAFYSCSSLTSLTIPSSVTSIGSYAFYSCSSLTSLTIPSSVTSIGSYAFYSCSSLTSLTIPSSVTSIGSSTFRNCINLSSVTIANSVTNVGSDPFSGTPWYDNHPDGLIYIGSVAYKYKGEMPANTQITLTDGTSEIFDGAFLNCKGLTSMTIPNSVKRIGESAFSGCI